MKVVNLTENTKHIYTANAYLITSDWKATADTTVLIDTGNDPSITYKIKEYNTGLGKKKLDKLILTHNHSDHAGLLPDIIREFNPEVYAYSRSINGIEVNHLLKDGQMLHIGNFYCEIFHISSHSFDSVCVYCEQEQILFSGDTSFPVKFDNPQLETQNYNALHRLSKKKIRTVYPGHGEKKEYKSRTFKVFNN